MKNCIIVLCAAIALAMVLGVIVNYYNPRLSKTSAVPNIDETQPITISYHPDTLIEFVDEVEPPTEQPIMTHDDELTIIHTDDQITFKPVDEFCLAKNIYHEARGEDLLGQLAVAQVTINRLKSKRYPNTICQVVMQPWQFSWANRHSNRWYHPKGADWINAKHLAEQFLKDGVRVRGLEKALYYHTDKITPRWQDASSKIAQVGNHIFYGHALNL